MQNEIKKLNDLEFKLTENYDEADMATAASEKYTVPLKIHSKELILNEKNYNIKCIICSVIEKWPSYNRVRVILGRQQDIFTKILKDGDELTTLNENYKKDKMPPTAKMVEYSPVCKNCYNQLVTSIKILNSYNSSGQSNSSSSK